MHRYITGSSSRFYPAHGCGNTVILIVSYIICTGKLQALGRRLSTPHIFCNSRQLQRMRFFRICGFHIRFFSARFIKAGNLCKALCKRAVVRVKNKIVPLFSNRQPAVVRVIRRSV